MIGPLTDPVAYGGRPEDAFDVVIPSIPGFGFSTRWLGRDGRWRVAQTYDTLMRSLGYESYGAHGSDGGAMISRELAVVTRPASWAHTCCSCSPFPLATRVTLRTSVPRITRRWSFSVGSSQWAGTTR